RGGAGRQPGPEDRRAAVPAGAVPGQETGRDGAHRRHPVRYGGGSPRRDRRHRRPLRLRQPGGAGKRRGKGAGGNGRRVAPAVAGAVKAGAVKFAPMGQVKLRWRAVKGEIWPFGPSEGTLRSFKKLNRDVSG